MWNFKGTLWNSTQNILLIHWKIRFLYNIGILRALRFKSSYAFLKRPPGLKEFHIISSILISRHLSFTRSYIMTTLKTEYLCSAFYFLIFVKFLLHRLCSRRNSLTFPWFFLEISIISAPLLKFSDFSLKVKAVIIQKHAVAAFVTKTAVHTLW